MPLLMLDTNIVSHIVRKTPAVLRNLDKQSVGSVFISSVTAGELYFGLAKRPDTKRTSAVMAVLHYLEVLPWNDDVAAVYGDMRARMESAGVGLSPLDALIAGHALAKRMILVTNDQAFRNVPGLEILDWTEE